MLNLSYSNPMTRTSLRNSIAVAVCVSLPTQLLSCTRNEPSETGSHAMAKVPATESAGTESGFNRNGSAETNAPEPRNDQATPRPRAGATLPKYYHESGGFATKTEAGLAGQVIKVTNLNKDGAGSLAAALAAFGKRLVVFEVGGVINLEGTTLTINNGEVTVAGQTAPAPGITIIRGTLNVPASDVVISHISILPGDGDGGEPDGLDIRGKNVVIDHVSIAWGIDEGLNIWGASNVTIFKTSISQQLSHATHRKAEHSKAMLIYRGSTRISLIGCLFAHNSMRNPRISDGKVLMANSVVYNWGEGKDEFKGDLANYNFVVHLGDNGESPEIPEVSFVGNVGLSGPNSKARHFLMGHKKEQGKAYMRDNIILDVAGKPLFESDERIIALDAPPLWPQGFEAIPAPESLFEVLRTVGSTPGRRDAVTTQIVTSVAEGSGKIINSQNEVGGYPAVTETRRAVVVPDGAAARRSWLDSLEDEIAVDKRIDLSRLYGRVGTPASDRLRASP